MARLANVTNNVFDSILPTIGNSRVKLPIWNEGDKMFLSSEYESASGHRYYQGLRFTDRVAVVETFGHYHTWKYIDCIDVYAFDGNNKVLIGTRKFDKTFYDQELIKKETEKILQEYFKGQMKLQHISVSEEQVKMEAKRHIEASYTSFLSDNYNPRLQGLLPLLGTK